VSAPGTTSSDARGSESRRISAARDGVSLHVSPLLLGCGLAAVASTILLAVLWYLDAKPPPPPRGLGPPPPPPPTHLGLLVVLGVFTICWVAVIAAVCRDQIIRQINGVAQQVTAATLEFGEHRETEGYLLAMRVAEAERGSTGGAVLPFPRPTEPPERAP
jgi:hypothetical protein